MSYVNGEKPLIKEADIIDCAFFIRFFVAPDK